MIKIEFLIYLLICVVLIQIISDHFVKLKRIENNTNISMYQEYLPMDNLPMDNLPRDYLPKPLIQKQRFKYAHPDTIRELYKMLYILDKVFTDYQIEYWMSGGTFLGAIRHTGIIPWDDDGDLEIFESNERNVASIGPILAKYDLVIVPTWFGFKIFPKYGKKIIGYRWLYPSIDIFVMKENPAKIINPMIMFKYKKAQRLFAKCRFNQNLMYPLKRYKFGSFELMGVNERNISPYFDKCYGNDWMDYAYEQYDHETEKAKKKIKLRLTQDEKNPALPIDPVDTYTSGTNLSEIPIIPTLIPETDYIY